MESRRYQFGLFALLVLTTVAAGSFAIIRLPLPFIAKFLIIQSIAVCFVGWAVRNRKYPDPRLPMKPARRKYHISMIAAMNAAFIAVLSWSYFRLSSRPLTAADLLFCGLMLSSVSLAVGFVVFAMTTKPKHT